MAETRASFLTIPRLEALSWLVHGFGLAAWREADFLAFAAAEDMRPVVMRQLHSDTAHRLDRAPAGKLAGDALMTNVPGLLLVIRTADCLPALLIDEEKRAVAAVHCGWRGTEKKVLEKAVKAMGEAYGSKPGEMLAALGPSIGAGCYEVGPEVREAFLQAGFPQSVFRRREEWGPEGMPGRSFLDLRAANIRLLEGAGLRKENIYDAGAACTHCDPALLSYRRNPRDLRRMFNFVGLRR